MTKATAAIVERRDGPFELVDVVLDEPRPHEVVVRIEAVGMCHSDLSVRSGATPFPLPGVLGHEGAGTVAVVGSDVTKVAIGDKVLISFASCGTCVPCQTGRPVECVQWLSLNLLGGSRIDGSPTIRRAGPSRGRKAAHGHFFGQSSFATHALAPERSLVKVAPDAPLDVLAPLGCAVQTGAGAVFNVLRPHAGGSLVVFGAGGVGMSAIMAARLTPLAHIIAVDLNEARLEVAQQLGATEVINPRAVNAVEAVRDITSDGADYSLETTGNTSVLRQAVDALAGHGTCGVIGAPPFGSEVHLDVPAMLVRNPRIVGINQGASVPDQLLPVLVELHRQQRFPIEQLITHFAFDDIDKAAAAAHHGDVIKPVLQLS